MTVSDSRRVLLVNDDTSFANSVRRLLSDEGYEARVARDGAAAVETIAEWSPHLVVLDLFMPRMNGLEFLQQRATNRALCGTPVLVWSVGVADEFDQARQLGATECLSRVDTTPEQFLATVARLSA